MSSNVEEFNDEIFIKIFSFLDIGSIGRVATVNQRFYQLAYDRDLWKFILEKMDAVINFHSNLDWLQLLGNVHQAVRTTCRMNLLSMGKKLEEAINFKDEATFDKIIDGGVLNYLNVNKRLSTPYQVADCNHMIILKPRMCHVSYIHLAILRGSSYMVKKLLLWGAETHHPICWLVTDSKRMKEITGHVAELGLCIIGDGTMHHSFDVEEYGKVVQMLKETCPKELNT